MTINTTLNRIEMRIMDIENKFAEFPVQPATLNNSQANKNITKEKFSDFFDFYAQKYGLDCNLAKAVAKAESGFNAKAVSAAGAQGLMQLMPDTAQMLGVNNPLDAEENIAGGMRYLKGLLDQYGGNTSLALAAYNAGPGNIKKYGGVPPFNETKNYVNIVQKYYQQMKQQEE